MKTLFLLFVFVILLPAGVRASTSVRVGLLERFGNQTAIGVDNTSVVCDQGFRWDSASGFTVRPYGLRVALYGGPARLGVFDAPLTLRDAYGGPMWLEGTGFRGGIEFARTGSQNLTAINILDIEDYLLSVVPSEMPPSWHPEALMAQAVAARTYALHQINNGAHEGFHLCDLVHCQRYRGIVSETEATNAAVRQTAGLIITHEGQPINAVYFASSGGVTEQPENVWQRPLPFLQSVPDPFEHEPVLWTRTFSLDEIGVLAARHEPDIGTVVGVSIEERHPSGRVARLVITGTGGDIALTREEIRTFFAPAAQGALPSRHFEIWDGVPQSVTVSDGGRLRALPVSEFESSVFVLSDAGVTAPPQTFTVLGADAAHTYRNIDADPPVFGEIVLTGSGFGHGVGMSQRGAEGMARRGYTFGEILTHFYTDVLMERITP